jgi:hypothetical protein
MRQNGDHSDSPEADGEGTRPYHCTFAVTARRRPSLDLGQFIDLDV